MNVVCVVVLCIVVFETVTPQTETREELDIGYFWQLTDVHFDPDYSDHGNPHDHCHPSKDSSRYIGHYGNHSCDAPLALVESAVEEMKKRKPDPDFILWTGDTVPHVDEESVDAVYSIINNVSSLLSARFPQTPLFPTLGNHDSFPANQMPLVSKSNGYYQNMLTRVGWAKFLSDAEQQQFIAGGYYSKLLHKSLKLILLNSNVWSSLDQLVLGDADPNGQFAWLRQQLKEAHANKIQVIIATHICPGAFERVENMTFFYAEYNKIYLSLMREFSSTVMAHFCGHEHTDSFRMMTDDQGAPTSLMFLSPAVTPWKSSVPGVGANNPAIRLYQYSRSTGRILDYFQYYLNLSLANKQVSQDSWQLEYQATISYSLPDCSAASFHNLTSSWHKSSAEFQTYLEYNSVCYYTNPVCGDLCYLRQTCAILNLDFDNYNRCLFKILSTSAPPVSSTPRKPHHPLPGYMHYVLGGMALIIVILVIIVSCLCARQRHYPGGFRYRPVVGPIN